MTGICAIAKTSVTRRDLAIASSQGRMSLVYGEAPCCAKPTTLASLCRRAALLSMAEEVLGFSRGRAACARIVPDGVADATRTLPWSPTYGLIDDHWHLDSTFKALRGICIGRDVAFTHGPIFQWLSSIPARSMPLSFGALYATWNTVPLWCAIVFAYLALRLLLPEQPSWKRFVLLLLLSSFWETSLRTTFPGADVCHLLARLVRR